MKRWLFNLAAGVSLLLCLAIIALLVRSYWAVDFAGWYDGVGGACGMTSCSGVIAAYRDRNGFGTGQSGYYYGRDKPDFWGAGPSFFAQVDSNLGRTNLSVPHWFVSILLAVLPLLRWWTYHKGRQLYRAGLCVHCGYDLRATPDRCPECGALAASGPATQPAVGADRGGGILLDGSTPRVHRRGPSTARRQATMGHRLFPIIEGAYLEPEEVAHRLRAEFPFVDSDRNTGADVVERAIREFRKADASEELLDDMRRQSLKAIRIIVSDRTNFGEDYLEFTVMPDGPPYVPYRSGRHVAAAAPLLSKVCKVLGYRAEAC